MIKTPNDILAGKPYKMLGTSTTQPYYHHAIVVNVAEEYADQFKLKFTPVKDGLPDLYQKCLFVIDSGRPEHNGKIAYGTYTGNPESEYDSIRNAFSTPGCGWMASHWCPVPEFKIE